MTQLLKFLNSGTCSKPNNTDPYSMCKRMTPAQVFYSAPAQTLVTLTPSQVV